MKKRITPYLPLYSAAECCGWRTNIDDFPDECLANVFEFLDLIDRKNCSLVCHRWFCIEGQSRRHLSFKTISHKSDLLVHPDICSLLTRFDSLTSLAFHFVRIDDYDLVLISLRCRKLTKLRLRCCRLLTDAGVADFALNCKGLKEFDAQCCVFGAEGINAILNNSSFLEHPTALNLDGFAVANRPNTMSSSIGPGVAASSLKTICIGETPSQFFVPLIIASKNLTSLKVDNCSGNWDKVFETMVKQQVTGLVEIQLTDVGISDAALVSISNFLDLETLRFTANANCTNAGLAYIANRCKRLGKLGIRNSDQIRDESIIAIAKGCHKLEELVLVRVNITSVSLNILARNCPKLERLALWKNDTVHDAEMRLIAANFMALKYLSIYACGITDQGVLALSSGCPNLLRLDILNCTATTLDGLNRLKAERVSLVICNHRRS